MMIVALTGGIGSGKSEATKLFANHGVPIVDLDIISHALTAANQPLVKVLADTFGDAVISGTGELNRLSLRKHVFNDEAELAKLNAIMHPAIHEAALAEIEQYQLTHDYLVISIPLLTEDSIYLPNIDRILLIDCDESLQIERVQRRNQLSEDEIKRIIASQPTRELRQRMADDIVLNNGNFDLLRQNIDELHQKYLKTCIVSKTIS